MSGSLRTLPGKSVAYVLRQGEGDAFNVAGQIITVLAGTDETAGGYGAVVCEATLDRQPIPLHYHEREYDTWFCTRGRLRIWAENSSRILTEGDFAFVPPNAVHAYQSVAPRTQFFGIVAPGGWEGFFEGAGSVWLDPGLPASNHPFDFSRMGPAMQRFGVMRMPEAVYAEVTDGDATDRQLPQQRQSFVLQSGYGPRHRLAGHLATTVLPASLCDDRMEIRTIEAGLGASMPPIRHAETHVNLYLLSGALSLVLDGETYVMGAGDFANIPAGTVYSTQVLSGSARWLLSSANGTGLAFWDSQGVETQEFTFQAAGDQDLRQILNPTSDLVDVTLAA